jgi:DNA replication protein DnaC
MIRDNTRYSRSECVKCTPRENCPVCSEKVKAPWSKDIPDRYKDASIDNLLEVNSQKRDTVDKFIDTVLTRNHKTNTGLYVYGDLGTGKTWLLYGVAKKLIEKANPIVSCFPPFHVEDCKALVFKFHCRYTGKGENSITEYVKEFVELTRNYVLMLDDLGHGNTTKDDFAMNIYNLLIDAIYVNMGFIAVSSNHSPAELKKYIGSYAVDRVMEMCGGNLIKIEGDSQRI